MAKKFDLKQFMLDRGERVGLWVAVGLMAVLVIFNLFMPGKGLFSGSPSANAKDIKDKASQGKNRITSAKPNDDLVIIAPEIQKAGVEFVAVNPEPYRPVADLFLPGQVGTDKRSMPAIKTPTEFGLFAALVQIRSYLFNKDGDIAVLKGLGGQEGGRGNMQGMRNMMSGARGGSGGARGGSGGGPPPMMAPGSGFNPQASGPQNPGLVDSSGKDGDLKYVKMDELGGGLERGDIRLAETIVPMRIGIVTASFPYRQQCEEFRAALKLPSLADVVRDEKLSPRFLGFIVKRCEVLPSGKTTPFEPLDLKKDFTPIVIHTGRRFQTDDEDLQPLIFDGLVMPRPLQFEGKEYPKAERLPGIKKTIDDLKKAANAGQVVTPASQRFSKDDLDIYSNRGSEGNEAGGGAAMPGRQIGPMPGTVPGRPPTGGAAASPGGSEVEEDAIPEYILVRFLDVTVKPGRTYQYQLQIRIANPNFKENDKVAYPSLAKDEELLSKPVIVAGALTVPYGFNYYAVDEKDLEKQDTKLSKKNRKYLTEGRDITGDKDVTAMQIHHWLEQYYAGGDRKNSGFPVGDWTLADRLLVYRGEYLARKAQVELPIWVTAKDQFVLAVNPKNRRQKTVETYFGEGSGPEPGPEEPVIVDFEGGKVSYDRVLGKGPDEKSQTVRIQDKAPIEVLVLAADGKLLVRNAAVDAEDQERKERRKAVAKRLDEVKNDKKKSETRPGDPLFDPRKPSGG